MAPKRLDLTGKIVGRLTVIRCLGPLPPSNKVYWECQCSCSAKTNLRSSQINCGSTKSCGCLAKDVARITNTIRPRTKRRSDFGKKRGICPIEDDVRQVSVTGDLK